MVDTVKLAYRNQIKADRAWERVIRAQKHLGWVRSHVRSNRRLPSIRAAVRKLQAALSAWNAIGE